MNEPKLIEHFARDIIRAEVDDWPDKSNRAEKEIDAVAGGIAIEHTSIDTLPGHRDMDARLKAVIGDLEHEMSGKVSAHIMLAFEFYAIRTGENWSAIGDAIKAWIINSVPDLSVGRHHIADAPGFSFALQVTKSTDLPTGLFFSRIAPTDATLPDRLHSLIARKAVKLAKDRWKEHMRILIVENNDTALMNDGKLFEAISKAFPHGLPVGVDQLWYADTSGGERPPRFAQYVKC